MGNGTTQTLVCVKQVKQESPEEWDESMPLPGDIIEGLAETDGARAAELLPPAKAKSELSTQLGKILSQQVELIWVKVRRGESILMLRARIVQDKCSMLHRKFTIKAATDDRHVVVFGDLTLEQCTKLQEMSRTVVSTIFSEFNKRGMKYDWNLKVDTFLPDQRCTVVSSILFMPMQGERCIQATTARCMAWLTAAISSGVPLVFVNIQTEQIFLNLEKDKDKDKTNFSGKEIVWGWQQNQTTSIQILQQGIRLWFLPGVAEVSFELTPKPGEDRFGMEIKRTVEGFICVFSITKGSAADRAGLRSLYEEAYASGHLLVISRLEGKSLTPSNVCSSGLIHCCDHNEIRDTLTSAIDQRERIQLHVMAWPNQTRPYTQASVAATLRPPYGNACCPPRPLCQS